MAERWFALSASDRRELLLLAASRTGRAAHLLEKDIWVVWALERLFGSGHGRHLVFKGGTSLSKAYGILERFSEDVDLTYDIRTIAADLVGPTGELLPVTRSQEKKWSETIRERLRRWVRDEMQPLFESAAGRGCGARGAARG